VTPTRVVLAEDDVLLREGLAGLLERHGMEVVGQAGDGRRLVALVERLRPDLVVTDVRMPPDHAVEGLVAARRIRAANPDVGILVLSAHVEVEQAKELLASGGGVGYLLKTRITRVEDFVEAARAVASGSVVIDPELVAEIVGRPRRHDALAALSEREREVLGLMAEGRSNAGIARRLHVAEATVEKHVRNILAKLSIPAAPDDHRRVLAVIAHLEAG